MSDRERRVLKVSRESLVMVMRSSYCYGQRARLAVTCLQSGTCTVIEKDEKARLKGFTITTQRGDLVLEQSSNSGILLSQAPAVRKSESCGKTA
jgi:hypothetical protein